MPQRLVLQIIWSSSSASVPWKCVIFGYEIRRHKEHMQSDGTRDKKSCRLSHRAVCPWYLHNDNWPLVLPRATRPSAGGSGDTNWMPCAVDMLGWLICHFCIALLCLQQVENTYPFLVLSHFACKDLEFWSFFLWFCYLCCCKRVYFILLSVIWKQKIQVFMFGGVV